ncbi:MAG: MotA/TolQ/ExbB proton channel family protein [Elusimicrobia bacterium]|nr:MotA/TolQ/ExbB proton channel family protein [Elusimicrobiota bacterium]
MHYGIREIIAAGGVVLFLLAGLSVYSLALIWERWNFFRRAMRDLRSLEQRLRRDLEGGDLHEALNHCRQHKSAAAEVVVAALTGPSQREDRKRSIERSLERHAAKLQRGLSVLATIGSVSPFIGLFGTVIGVMRAFRDLAGAAGAGPGVVAVGISEALIATAAGLFVAIPATVGYNYFSTRVLQLTDELRWITDEILDHLTQKPHA